MNRLPIVTRRAEIEMNRAIIWYEEKNPSLGLEFIADPRNAMLHSSQNNRASGDG